MPEDNPSRHPSTAPRDSPVRPTCPTLVTTAWMPYVERADCAMGSGPWPLLGTVPIGGGSQPQQQWPRGGTLPSSTISGSHLAPVLCRALALAVGELLDAVVDSNAALARCQVLLGDLYPAQ